MKIRSSFAWFCATVFILSGCLATSEHVSTARVITRAEQKLEDTWDLTRMYSGAAEWRGAYSKEAAIDYDACLVPYRLAPKLTPQDLRELLDLYHERDRSIDKLYWWAYLSHIQDVTSKVGITPFFEITARRQLFREKTSWIYPKILSHEQAELDTFIQAPELACYNVLLKRIIRLKPHSLPNEQEALLTLSVPSASSAAAAYSSLTDGDVKFPQIEDGKGDRLALSNALLWQYLKSPDRVLRENAFKGFYGTYRQYEHTLAQLLQGQMQRDVFAARARNYPSCLEAALFPKNIPTDLYHNLVQTVRSHVDVLHRYVHLIKQYRQVDALHPYDLQPLASEDMGFYSYNEAVSLIVEACRPLGPAYAERLKSGLTIERWVDRYENMHKKSGAGSGGCYDSPPYILMNYAGTLWDIYRLAHEAGHSMASELSRYLPYHYSAPISWQSAGFSQEVPSTFHEHLLSHYLLGQARSDHGRELKLLDEHLSNMVIHIYLQTLFAEYDLFVHECAEQRIPLTPEMLSEKWTELFAFYYGNELTLDEEVGVMWATFPHFYRNFYLYHYPTSFIASQALAEQVLQGGEKERETYLTFLRTGQSLDTLEALQIAGVDMTTPRPVEQALQNFNHLLDRFEALLRLTQAQPDS